MKKAKIAIIISLILTLIAVISVGTLYSKLRESTAKLNEANIKLKRTEAKLYSAIEKNKQFISANVPDSVETKSETLLESETLLQTKKLEEERLIQDIFSLNKKTRLQTTETLVTYWTQDESLISNLIDFANNRFGPERQNMSGIINTIFVLNRMDSELLEKNKDEVLEFINKVEQLENRNQTQEYLETLKDRMK